MAQEQVAPSETAFALWALERLLLRVGPLMSLQMLEPCESAAASGTAMRTGLISLRRREICSRSLGVDCNSGGLYSCGSHVLADRTRLCLHRVCGRDWVQEAGSSIALNCTRRRRKATWGWVFGIPVSSPWGAVTSGSVEGGELDMLAVDMADSSFGPASLPIVLD